MERKRIARRLRDASSGRDHNPFAAQDKPRGCAALTRMEWGNKLPNATKSRKKASSQTTNGNPKRSDYSELGGAGAPRRNGRRALSVRKAGDRQAADNFIVAGGRAVAGSRVAAPRSGIPD